MALKVGELYASFGIDQSALDGAMKSIEEKCNKIANDLTTTGLKLSLAVTTPIIKVGKEIIQAAIDYEDAFASVRKTVDIESGNVEAGYLKIKDALLEMSTAMPQEFPALAEIAANAGQLGVSEQYITSFTRVIADLSVATDLSGDAASSMLAQYSNITGMDLGDIDRLGSTIVDLGNNTATTESAIVEMMQRLAGSGSIIGLSDAQIAGLSATLSSLGIDAEAGGSAMSRVLSSMDSAVISNGKELKKFAKIAGVSSKDFAAAWKADPISALQLFTQGLNNISNAGGDVNAALEQVGINDVRMTDMLKRLMGSGDMLTENVTMANTAWDENNALTEEASKRYATLKSKLQMAKNALTNTGAAFGDFINNSASLGSVVDMFKDWAISLGTVDDTTKSVILKVAGLAAAAGPAMIALGGIVKFAGQLAPVLSFLISPMSIVAGGLALMAIAAVDANNDIGKAFESISKTAKVKLQTMTKTIMAQIKTISNRMPALTTSIVNGIKDMLPQITSTAVQIVSGLMDTISENADEILSIGTTIISSIADGLSESLPGLISSGAGIVTSIASALIKAVPNIISAAATLAAALWNGIKNTDWVTLGKQIIDAIGTSVSSVWSLFKGWFEEAKTAIQNIDWETVWETIQSKFGDVKAWFSEKWTQAKEAVQNIDWATLGSNILSTIKVTKDALVSKAKEIINGLAEKLGDPDVTSTIQSITGVAATIAGKIITSKADWLGTATNFISKLIEQLVDSGFLSSAITTAADTLGSIVVAIANAIGDNASTIVSCAADLMTELLKGLADSDALSTILSSAADAVIAIANAIADNADEIATSALDLALKLVEGLASLDWYTISNSLATALGNLVNAIVTWFSKPENVDRLKKAGIAIADGIFSGATDGKLRISEIANELVGSAFDRSALDVTKAVDAGRYFADSWTDSWMVTLTQGISDGSLTMDQQLAMAVALMGQGFGDQIKELSPSIYDSANGMFNSVYRAVNDGNIIANFASIGYRITDELALAISNNQINVEDAARALSVGMSDEMILSMSQSELRTYLNTYFDETSVEITALLKNSATDWGKIFGQAIPDGATIGLSNGMVQLRSATGEVIAEVSAVNAKATVEAGNKDTAQAGVDAMSGTISGGETDVSDASTKVAAAAVSPFEGLPDETKAQAALMMAAINEAIAAGSPEATAAVEVAAQAVSDKASEILNGDTGKAVGEAYVGGIDTGINNKKSTVETTMNTVANAIKTKATSILTSLAGSSIGRTFATGISSALSAMQSTLTNAASTIANAARNSASGTLTYSSGSSIGYNFSLGIASGIRNGISAITAAATAAAQAALTAAKRRLDINSPSGAAEDEVGAMFDAGGAKGILGNMGLLIDAAKTAGTAMLDSFYVSDPSHGTAYESTGSRNTTGTGSGQGAEPTQATLDPVAVGTAMADRLIETGALQGDVYMDKDKVGVKTSAASSKEIQRQAKSGWKGRTAGTVVGT